MDLQHNLFGTGRRVSSRSSILIKTIPQIQRNFKLSSPKAYKNYIQNLYIYPYMIQSNIDLK